MYTAGQLKSAGSVVKQFIKDCMKHLISTDSVVKQYCATVHQRLHKAANNCTYRCVQPTSPERLIHRSRQTAYGELLFPKE